MHIPPDVVWYLAHPLKTDEHYSFEENMAHVVSCIAMCYQAGVRVIAPYYGICSALPDADSDCRQVGIEVDITVVKMLDRIILAGHKISDGMRMELQSLSVYGSAISMVGIPDVAFPHVLQMLMYGDKNPRIIRGTDAIVTNAG